MEALRAKLMHKLAGITVPPASTITDTTIITPATPSGKAHGATETHEFSAPTGAAQPPIR